MPRKSSRSRLAVLCSLPTSTIRSSRPSALCAVLTTSSAGPKLGVHDLNATPMVWWMCGMWSPPSSFARR
jgi:hypothetical protein